MPTEPELALTCRLCGWRPDEDEEMQVVKDHFDTEHQAEPVALDLTGICPRDQATLTVRMTGRLRDGRAVTTYDCPNCSRTYQVRWAGEPGHQA